MVDQNEPVASAVGGGFITAGGEVVRGSPDIDAPTGTSFGGATSGSAKVARREAEDRRRREDVARKKAQALAIKRAKQSILKRARAEQSRIKRARATKSRKKTRVILTRAERVSLQASNRIKSIASQRGRGFSRVEVQRFLKAKGGSITALRSARRKGFSIGTEKKKEEEKKLKLLLIPKLKLDKNIKDTLKNEAFVFDPQIQTTEQINQSIKKDVKSGIVSKGLLNVADIVSGGAITERGINKDQASLNSRVVKFNNKFGGRELSESEFKKANAEQKFIDSQQSSINNRTDKLANSKRDSINDFFAKLSIEKSPRLTTEQQNKIIKARDDDKDIQGKIKKNQPSIKNLDVKIKNTQKEIGILKKKDRSATRDIKLSRLNNKNNKFKTDRARFKFEAPPKLVTGTFPIIPAGIPGGTTKIKFVGNQKVGKDGKVVTDIFFETSSGRVGVAKGVRGNIGKDGKVIEFVSGSSGKIAISLAGGRRKTIGIQTFVSVESVSSKSKVLKTIVNLTKNGEISSSKAKKLKAIVKNAFKGDVTKINIKKAKSLRLKMKMAIGKGTNRRRLLSRAKTSKKIESIDLKKNLIRLKKRGLISVKKVESGIGKRTRGRRRILEAFKPTVKITKKDFVKRIISFRKSGDITLAQQKNFIKTINSLSKKGRIPKDEFLKIARQISAPKKLKKFQKKFIDKITKKDFIKRIKSFRSTGDITAIQEKRFLRRITKLSKKGDIPKAEFLRIARNIKTPKDLKKLPKLSFDTRLKPLDLQKNLARLRKRGQVPFKKSKIGKKTFVKSRKPVDKRPIPLSLKSNLRRLSKQNKFIRSARDSAREPNFNKIISRLKRQEGLKRNKDNQKSISNNLRVLEQSGMGKSFSVKGKKIFRPRIKFPSGKVSKKLVKPISRDEFASISSVLTKGDLNLIVGKTITRAKDKAEFIGIIKGTNKVTDSSTGSLQTKQQFSKALEKVLQKVASAVAKAEKTSPATKAAKIATATAFLSRASLGGSQKSIVKQVSQKASHVGSKIKKTTIAPQRISILQKSKASLASRQKKIQSSISKQKSKSAQLSKQKSKSAQATKQRVNQKVAQLQKSKTALKFKQKQITKQIRRGRAGISPPRPFRLFSLPKFKKKKFKGSLVKKKGKNSFDVFARPVKGKRLVKVNKVPLTRQNANDLRNFIIDTSLSARGKIKPSSGKPMKSRLKVPRGFAKRTSVKFRRVRFSKGRRIPLPKGSVIERRGRRLDTKSERRKITLAKRIKQITRKEKSKRKTIRKQPPKKTNNQRRAQLLKNLKKARIKKAQLASSRRRRTSGSRTRFRRIISTI